MSETPADPSAPKRRQFGRGWVTWLGNRLRRWSRQGISVESVQLVGRWKLIEVNHAPPATLNIKSHLMRISPDGTWTAKCEMQGVFEGVAADFAGTWSLWKGQLSVTAGSNSGTSRPARTETQLTLDPDFVLAIDENRVMATYVQVPPDVDRQLL